MYKFDHKKKMVALNCKKKIALISSVYFELFSDSMHWSRVKSQCCIIILSCFATAVEFFAKENRCAIINLRLLM